MNQIFLFWQKEIKLLSFAYLPSLDDIRPPERQPTIPVITVAVTTDAQNSSISS